jgi:hypothetical protein
MYVVVSSVIKNAFIHHMTCYIPQVGFHPISRNHFKYDRLMNESSSFIFVSNSITLSRFFSYSCGDIVSGGHSYHICIHYLSRFCKLIGSIIALSIFIWWDANTIYLRTSRHNILECLSCPIL